MFSTIKILHEKVWISFKKNLVVINTKHYLNGLKNLRFDNMVL